MTFLIYKLFVIIKQLPLLSKVKLPSVEFIRILTAFLSSIFYHFYNQLSLVLFTHLLIDAWEFARVELNYTMN